LMMMIMFLGSCCNYAQHLRFQDDILVVVYIRQAAFAESGLTMS